MLHAVVDRVDPANLSQYSLFLSHRVNDNQHACEQEVKTCQSDNFKAMETEMGVRHEGKSQ